MYIHMQEDLENSLKEHIFKAFDKMYVNLHFSSEVKYLEVKGGNQVMFSEIEFSILIF